MVRVIDTCAPPMSSNTNKISPASTVTDGGILMTMHSLPCEESRRNRKSIFGELATAPSASKQVNIHHEPFCAKSFVLPSGPIGCTDKTA